MSTVPAAPQQRGKTRLRSTPLQRWTLGLASVATFVVVLDLLVVATALTAIRRNLGASVGQLECARAFNPDGNVQDDDAHDAGPRRTQTTSRRR